MNTGEPELGGRSGPIYDSESTVVTHSPSMRLHHSLVGCIVIWESAQYLYCHFTVSL